MTYPRICWLLATKEAMPLVFERVAWKPSHAVLKKASLRADIAGEVFPFRHERPQPAVTYSLAIRGGLRSSPTTRTRCAPTEGPALEQARRRRGDEGKSRASLSAVFTFSILLSSSFGGRCVTHSSRGSSVFPFFVSSSVLSSHAQPRTPDELHNQVNAPSRAPVAMI